MKWYAIEDKICCLVFIKNHVLNESILLESIKEAQHYGVDKKESSIRMKFSNIATLCDEYGIKISNNIKRLEHYSIQNQQEFESVLDFSFGDIVLELNRIKSQK